MASPSEEVRSRQQLREREDRPAAEQASVDASRTAGEDNALAGWTRTTARGKNAEYRSGGSVYKGLERESAAEDRGERNSKED